MAAKMAAKNLILMYISFAFRYKDKWCVYSYAVNNVKFKYEEISNNNCIIYKMAAKMAPENLILMYLILLSDTKTIKRSPKDL